ncbi:MAG: thiolase family protein [Pseudomonadota bacterium]
MTGIFLAGGRRTPFGDFGKSLKDVPLSTLGAHAARASLDAAGLAPERVDHLVWGNVLPVDHDGYFTSRVVGQTIGLPVESCALNVSRACGSGSQAILSAAEQILSGHGAIALAGGGENFSRAPFVSTAMRWGATRGPQTLIDTLDWAYRDPFSLALMGETAEALSDDFGYDREAMDDYARTSQQRAGAAIESGFLARQISPLEVLDGKTTRVMDRDEFPRPTVTLEKLAKLRPVFRKEGRVTPGNSSGVTDGAAMVVVGDRQALARAGVDARIELVDWAIVGVPPRIMGCGPVPAIRKLLQKRELRLADIDYFEVNEAFAAVNLHAERELGLERSRTNLYGGGISIGHPPGATGARLVIVAMQHLLETGARRAVVSLCMGAGQGMALLLEAHPA